MNKYVVDLEMLSKELTSDEWINSLDAKLKDSAERPQIIKVQLFLWIFKIENRSICFHTNVNRCQQTSCVIVNFISSHLNALC